MKITTKIPSPQTIIPLQAFLLALGTLVCVPQILGGPKHLGVGILKSACVMGREAEHSRVISNSPVRQQNAVAHSFSELPMVLLFKLQLHLPQTPTLVGTDQEIAGAAPSKLPPAQVPVSHTQPRG